MTPCVCVCRRWPAVTYGFYDRTTLTGHAPQHVVGSIAKLAEALGLQPMAVA